MAARFLPSKDELTQLYNNKSTVGGFVAAVYYSSSSETTATNNWDNYFGDGTSSSGRKDNAAYVRPIRAF